MSHSLKETTVGIHQKMYLIKGYIVYSVNILLRYNILSWVAVKVKTISYHGQKP